MARSTVFNSDGARPRRLSLALTWVCAIDAEPPVKARMLRELATWYRAFATRSGNPVIWESRLLTAEDLDAEANSIDPQRDGR
jgi:hypothetical protein